MVSPDTGYGDLEAITAKTESAFYHKHTLQFVSRIRDDTHWKKKIKTHSFVRVVRSPPGSVSVQRTEILLLTAHCAPFTGSWELSHV